MTEVKNVNSLSLVTTIILLLVTNIANTFSTWWLNRAERPSALIGYIKDPPGAVTVSLNNGHATQVADDLSGWFGFDHLRRGEHHLRVEFEGYYSQAVVVSVLEPEVNFLRQDIDLIPLTEPEAPAQPINIGTTYVPRYTRNGAAPFIDPYVFLKHVPDLSVSDDTGWIYLGSADGEGPAFRDLPLASGVDLAERIIYTSTPTIVWSDAPEKRLFKGYALGQPKATIEPGSRLMISRDYREIGDGEFWAAVYIEDNGSQ